jgi:uncharacterized membrane protein YdjX (TVP38/TMEM64 family)
MPAADQDLSAANPPGQARTVRRNAQRWFRWLLAAVLVAVVAGFYLLGLQHYISWDYVHSHIDSLQARVQQQLPLAALVFFLGYVLVTAFSIPVAAVLSLVAGAIFGRWLGTVLVGSAATLGATAAFVSSRYLFREFVQSRFSRRLEPINRGVEKDGAYYLFTLRLLPVVPFWLINLAMGLTRMRVATFAWVSLLGMLPGTFLYVNAGRELSRITSPSDVLSPTVLISLALLGLVPLMFRKLLQ